MVPKLLSIFDRRYRRTKVTMKSTLCVASLCLRTSIVMAAEIATSTTSRSIGLNHVGWTPAPTSPPESPAHGLLHKRQNGPDSICGYIASGQPTKSNRHVSNHHVVPFNTHQQYRQHPHLRWLLRLQHRPQRLRLLSIGLHHKRSNKSGGLRSSNSMQRLHRGVR